MSGNIRKFEKVSLMSENYFGKFGISLNVSYFFIWPFMVAKVEIQQEVNSVIFT